MTPARGAVCSADGPGGGPTRPIEKSPVRTTFVTLEQPAQDHGFRYGTSSTDPDGNARDLTWMDRAALQG